MNTTKISIILLLILALLTGCTTGKPELAPSDYLNYKTKAYLLFPVKGESFIAAGGRTIEQNHHASEIDQRYALDIVALEPGSKIPSAQDIKTGNFITHNGYPKINESYYIFGRNIISPANGIVVGTFDGVPDAIPSESHYDFITPAGNHVVIDHGNNEYSMFAHLQNGSVAVKNGEDIMAGHLIGRVGNSGNSTEPHLHFHLQNTPKWGSGKGLPAQFNQYISNGNYVEKGEPVQGEIIVSN